jgi:hypothetical protein
MRDCDQEKNQSSDKRECLLAHAIPPLRTVGDETFPHKLQNCPQTTIASLGSADRPSLCIFEAQAERPLLWRDDDLIFASEPANSPIEDGRFVPHRFLDLCER